VLFLLKKAEIKIAKTIKGINIKLSLDGKDLDNELMSINKEFKEQQKDLKAINSNLSYDSSNVEFSRKKQSQLNEMLQTTKMRYDT
jgi:phage-related minor tail protein